VKSFLSYVDPNGSTISITVALSQTPVYVCCKVIYSWIWG